MNSLNVPNIQFIFLGSHLNSIDTSFSMTVTPCLQGTGRIQLIPVCRKELEKI